MRKLKKIILKKSFNTKSSHPWIYKNHIALVDPEINTGDIADIITHDNKYFGTGYYNPKSLIAIRIISFNEEQIDKHYFTKYISNAFQKRAQIKKISNAFRIVSSEADLIPGLIMDQYNDTIVFQINTAGMDKFKNEIIYAINEIIKPDYLFEKSDTLVRRIEGLKKEVNWYGASGKENVEIYEGKAKFIVDIVHGHKTGFYLDQRKARMAITNFAKGRRVLDVFCYTGGFSVHALQNNAKEALCIDLKDEWLDQVKINAGINNIENSLTCIKGAAFNILNKLIQKKEVYDMIILDPPSFLKSKHGLKTAFKGYLELNRLAMHLLSEKGILCTFSCSHHMRNELFFEMLKNAAELENKTFSILKRCHQDKDHPIITEIPETEYLKGYFLSVSTKN
jgi:23S rRNA (cytosine1962-C5)-methyltransferase